MAQITESTLHRENGRMSVVSEIRQEFLGQLENARFMEEIGCPTIARRIRNDADEILHVRLLKLERMKAA